MHAKNVRKINYSVKTTFSLDVTISHCTFSHPTSLLTLIFTVPSVFSSPLWHLPFSFFIRSKIQQTILLIVTLLGTWVWNLVCHITVTT